MNSGCQHATSAHPDWERWLRRLAPAFLLFARQHSRYEDDAQDLVQDAVVECWRRQANGAPPAAGLVFATIRRRAIDLARSHDRRAEREALVARESPEHWFDSGVEDHERNRLMQDAMSRLPEIYRDVITLKVWGDLTFVEIAQALEIPPNTAASRYRYGLAELRKLAAKVFP